VTLNRSSLAERKALTVKGPPAVKREAKERMGQKKNERGKNRIMVLGPSSDVQNSKRGG
jgi:hypothetical protein